jgi:hypothetical protein
MKSFIPVLMIIGAMVSVRATGVDPSDAILIAYTLTPVQKAEFSATDGKISKFWETDWIGRDYIDMNTATSSYPGVDNWEGEDDARMSIKAAGDAEGLYLYMEVSDNLFIDPDASFGYQYDACDLYFDALSSDEIRTGGTEIFVNPGYGWAMTFTSQQFQIFMGGATIPNAMRYNYYDPLYFDFTFNHFTFEEIPSRYMGMAIEVVRIDETSKAQEWFIPWNYIGVVGIPAGTVLAGRKFGFAGGYNDMDGNADAVNMLRWRTRDPFSPTPDGSGVSQYGLESWGDIEMDADMPAAKGVGVRYGAVKGRVKANDRIAHSAFYNLRGGKIGFKEGITRNKVLVQRSVLSNGSIVSRMTLTP